MTSVKLRDRGVPTDDWLTNKDLRHGYEQAGQVAAPPKSPIVESDPATPAPSSQAIDSSQGIGITHPATLVEGVKSLLGNDPSTMRFRGWDWDLTGVAHGMKEGTHSTQACELFDSNALVMNAGRAGTVTLVENRFRELVKEWHEETGSLSSPSKIASHPAYLQIVSMGQSVVPLVLGELDSRGGYWYPALRALTGANPVPGDAKGKPRLIKEEWLAWGRTHGYL